MASVDPRDRAGVYKSLDDVDRERHRLGFYATAYAGRDVWAEFQALRTEEHGSDSFRRKIERTGRYWREHMDDRGRPHALARPSDVEAFFADLLTDRTISSVYQPYYVQLSAFYEWLLWHTDHPHVYDPVLLAAIDGGATRDLFDYATRRTQ